MIFSNIVIGFLNGIYVVKLYIKVVSEMMYWCEVLREEEIVKFIEE